MNAKLTETQTAILQASDDAIDTGGSRKAAPALAPRAGMKKARRRLAF